MSDLERLPQIELTDDGLTPHYGVKFPGGNVQIIQTTDGKFWVHIQVNQSKFEGEQGGRIKAARLDCVGKCVQEMDVGDFNNPDLYHLAVLIEPSEEFVQKKYERF